MYAMPIPKEDYYKINEPMFGVLLNGKRKFYDTITAAYHASQQNGGIPFMRSGYEARYIEKVNGKITTRRDLKRAYK